MINTFGIYKERCRHLKGVGEINDFEYDYSALNCYDYFKDILSMKEYQECKNFQQKRSKKRKRCFDNYFKLEIISKMLNCKMVFGTITFDDHSIDMPYENMKKNIQYYLKKHFFYVIKNADYGEKTNRLHYHFIGLTFDDFISCGKKSKKGRPMYNLKNDNWKYGFKPNYEIIPYDMKEKKRLSNYIVKLNNHSNKISVRKSRLSILKNKKYLEKYCTFTQCIV